MDLLNELQSLNKQFEMSVRSLRINGIKYAEAERDYKIAVNKKVLELKDNKMAVGLINLTIYGYQEIATLRFMRDSAQVIYNANQEAINSIKLRMRLIESQINREFGLGENK